MTATLIFSFPVLVCKGGFLDVLGLIASVDILLVLCEPNCQNSTRHSELFRFLLLSCLQSRFCNYSKPIPVLMKRSFIRTVPILKFFCVCSQVYIPVIYVIGCILLMFTFCVCNMFIHYFSVPHPLSGLWSGSVLS